MLRLIKKIRIETFFSTMLQFVLLLALGFIYVTNVFNLQQYLSLTTFVFITLGIGILNTIYLLVQVARVVKIPP